MSQPLPVLLLTGGIANRQLHADPSSNAVTQPTTNTTHVIVAPAELIGYFFNACSILNKLPDLETFLRINTPAFVGICETHTYSEIPDEVICPNGYSIFRKDRNKFGGGVALLVRNDITVSFVDISNEFKGIEVCCVDLLLHTDKFRVIVYYRPPYYTLADEQYLDLSLHCLSSLICDTSSQVILMGDFNLPNVDWIHYSAPSTPIYDKFMSFVNEGGLFQFVLEPTRHENILDLLITNVPNVISDLQAQCPFSTSDHNIVRFSVNICHDWSNVLDDQGSAQYYYDFSSGDYDAMEAYLMNVNWSSDFTFALMLKIIGRSLLTI